MGDGWLIAPSITEASVARLGIPAATTSAAEPWYASSFPAATALLKQPCSPARRSTGIGSPNAGSAWQTCGLRMRCTDYRREDNSNGLDCAPYLGGCGNSYRCSPQYPSAR